MATLLQVALVSTLSGASLVLAAAWCVWVDRAYRRAHLRRHD